MGCEVKRQGLTWDNSAISLSIKQHLIDTDSNKTFIKTIPLTNFHTLYRVYKNHFSSKNIIIEIKIRNKL